MFHEYGSFPLYGLPRNFPPYQYGATSGPMFYTERHSHIDRSEVLSENEFKELIKNIHNGSIQAINLTKRCVNDHQFLKIIEVLAESRNCRVSELYLSGNLITDRSMENLFLLVKESTNFVNIDLSYNKISEEGAKCFLQALKCNITLVHLNLFNNLIGNNILTALQNLILRNIEIQREIKQFNYYVATAILSKAAGLPEEMTYLILDYCNEASLYEAQLYIRKVLYCKASKMAENLTLTETEEISRRILPQKSIVCEDALRARIEQVQKQYDDLILLSIAAQEDPPLDEKCQQEKQTLSFSRLNLTTTQNLNNMQKTETRSYFSKCCVLL